MWALRVYNRSLKAVLKIAFFRRALRILSFQERNLEGSEENFMKAGLLEERIKPADNEGVVCVRDTQQRECALLEVIIKSQAFMQTQQTHQTT